MTKTSRNPALDGIKGLAFLSVLLYHMVPHLFTGGFLGVNVFFVLAGYFSTSRAIKTAGKEKGRFFHFFFNRIRRLYPPLIGMLVGVTAYVTVFQPAILHDIRMWIVSSITFTNNWWQIGNGYSYFNQFYPPAVFTHLWYLSVLGQCYLLWPFLVSKIGTDAKGRRKLLLMAVLLLLASAGWMAYLYQKETSLSRIYYGTDTRVFSFLAGSWMPLAASSPLFQPFQTFLEKRKNWIGLLTAGASGLCIFLLQDSSRFTNSGGMLLFDIVTVLFLTVAAEPGNPWNKVLRFKPLVWTGRRSYSLHLWYFPVLVLYQEAFGTSTGSSGMHAVLQLLVLFVLAEGSYRFLERRRWSFPAVPAKKAAHPFGYWRESASVGSKLAAAGSVLLLGVSCYSMFFARSEKKTEAQALQTRIESNIGTLENDKNTQAEERPAVQNIDGLSRQATQYAYELPVTFIGDSVLLAIADDLMAIYPEAVIDGEVGRQLYDSYDTVESLKEAGTLHKTVVAVLGANGTFSNNQLEDFISAVGEEQQLFFLTTNVPRTWQASVNAQYRNAAEKHENIKVIDWLTYSQDHPEWFYEDKVHPKEDGSAALAAFIAEEVYKTTTEDSGS